MIYAFIAFIAVAALIPLCIKLAPVLKLVDVPCERKQHEGEIPLIGGLVIFPVVLVCYLLMGFSFSDYWPFYISIVLLLVIGALDDKVQIAAWSKFFVQSCVAIIIVFGGDAHIRELGNLFGFGNFDLGFMSWIFSLAAVVLLVNAVNLMDGLDGLSSGTVFVALCWLAYAFLSAGDGGNALMVMIMLGGIAGFLAYNMRHPFRKKAALFLGDAGSLCLGLTLAWFAITAAKDVSTSPLQPMSVAWILALPIYDTCAQFYRRVRLGRHPFSPDRGHFHHHFIEAGIADGKAVFVILVLAAALGGIGVFVQPLYQPLFTVLWIIGLLAHMHMSDKPERYVSLFARLKRSP